MRLSENPERLVEVVAGVVEPQVLVDGRDALNLVVGQVEAVDLEVLLETVLAVGLGNDGNAALGGPAEQNLGGGHAVLGGDALDDIVVEEKRGVLSTLHLQLQEALGTEAGVGSDGDLVLLDELDELGLNQVGVVLDLQRRERVTVVGQKVKDELGGEVADADALRNALVDDLLESLPGLAGGDPVGLNGAGLVHPPALYLSAVRSEFKRRNSTHGVRTLLGLDVLERDGEVNEEEVDVAQTPDLVLLAHHVDGNVLAVVVVPELGGDEDVLALHQTLADGPPDALAGLLLVLVVVGAIEQPVAGLDSLSKASEQMGF